MGATIKDITGRIKRDIEGLFSFMEINLSQEEFKDYCDNVASIVVYINKATKADIDIKKPVSNVDKVTKTLLFPSELNDELKMFFRTNFDSDYIRDTIRINTLDIIKRLKEDKEFILPNINARKLVNKLIKNNYTYLEF